MANLAIKGHLTRGEEVIRILEMLGGINKTEYSGDQEFAYYFINNNYIDWCYEFIPGIDFICFTLEEFLEEFPYKVGDKVNYVKYNDEYPDVYTIQRMRWVGTTIEYLLDSSGFSVLTKDLQPYKEESMENKGTLVEIDLTREESKAEEIEVILGDYEFVLKDGKTYFVKKKPEYPKTYEECCEVLGKTNSFCFEGISLDEIERVRPFIKLLRCRDAYWKIAGKQLGLDKPWEYDMSKDEFSYAISYQYGYIQKNEIRYKNAIFAFPTAEIRDAFKENFKELIEECKEFL